MSTATMSSQTPGERLMSSWPGRWLLGTVHGWDRGGGGGGELTTVTDLADGEVLVEVARSIDPRVAALLDVPPHDNPDDAEGAAATLGTRRLKAVLEAVTRFSEDCLNVAVLMELPIVEVIVDNPESEEAVYELHRLILLMLGCAVRGKNGQQHVDLIKSFDEKMQHDVKDALAASMNDEVPTATAEDIEFMSKDELADALRRARQCLVQSLSERDKFAHEAAILKLSGRQSDSAEADSGAKRRRAQTEIALLLGELADKEAAVQEMQRALETTGMELVAERSKCRALQADVDESAALRDEVELWKTRAEERARNSVTLDAHRVVVNELEALQFAHRELQEQNDILTAQNTRFKSDRRMSTVLDAQRATAAADAHRLVADLADLTSKHDANVAKMNHYHRLGRERRELEQELRCAQERLAQMSHDAQRARDTAEELAAAKTALLRREEELHELQCTVNQLQSVALQHDAERARDTAEELAATQSALLRRVTELEDLRIEIDELKSAAADQVAKAEERAKTCNALTTQVEAVTAERDALASRLAAAEAARNAIRKGPVSERDGHSSQPKADHELQSNLPQPTVMHRSVQTDVAPLVRVGGPRGVNTAMESVPGSPLRLPTSLGEHEPIPHSPNLAQSHPRLASRLGNIIRDSGEKAVYCASPPMRYDRDRAAVPTGKIHWDDMVSVMGSPLASARYNRSGGDHQHQRVQPLRDRVTNVPPLILEGEPKQEDKTLSRTSKTTSTSAASGNSAVQRPQAPLPPTSSAASSGRSSGATGGLKLVSKRSRRDKGASGPSDADVQALLEQLDRNISRAKGRTLVLETTAKANSRLRHGNR